MINLFIKRIKVNKISNGFLIDFSHREFTDPVYDKPSYEKVENFFFETEEAVNEFVKDNS